MKVLITGSNGFIGTNLQLRLKECDSVQIINFNHYKEIEKLSDLLKDVDFVFHLAGVNRSNNPDEFKSGNSDLTRNLCQLISTATRSTGRRIPILYASSIHAEQDNIYGRSKREAEKFLLNVQNPLVPVFIFRLPNVFGKWCKPNYNSVVATFCHNIARGLTVKIDDPNSPITLVYIDDVLDRFIGLMNGANSEQDPDGFEIISPQYTITVGKLADQIMAFRESRKTLTIDTVGIGFMRALYATYVSYLPVESFAYELPQYADQRGIFVEMLKTISCGQFSFFTTFPGVTRGGHYHHTKNEKFLVIKGRARFRFRHMSTGEVHVLETYGEKPVVVESIPGWTHDITNIGSEEMLVMLWANEIFDRVNPDTCPCPIEPS